MAAFLLAPAFALTIALATFFLAAAIAAHAIFIALAGHGVGRAAGCALAEATAATCALRAAHAAAAACLAFMYHDLLLRTEPYYPSIKPANH